MPVYVKVLVCLWTVYSIIYLISYAVYELKKGTLKGGAAALGAAVISAAVFLLTIAKV